MRFYLNLFTSDEQFPFFIQYGEHYEDLTMHDHDDFSELVIVLNGNAMHIVNDEASFIKKGDVFVIGGQTAHAYRDPENLNICNIMYRPEMLNTAGPDLKSTIGYQALFVLEPFYRNVRHYKSKLSLSISSLEYVSGLIAAMMEEYNQKAQGYQTMLASKFMELVVYLSRQYERQDRETQRHLLHLARALSYIEDHFLEDLSLEEIASNSNISVRHLNRVFKSYYQTSPHAYVLKLRLERACTLLRETKLSVTEVSVKCGFHDSNYFTRQFSKMLGMTPGAYRKDSRQGNNDYLKSP